MALTVREVIELLNKPEYLDKQMYLCYDSGCLLPVEKIEDWNKGYVIVTGNGHQSNHWLEPKNGYSRIYDSEDPKLELKAYRVWPTKATIYDHAPTKERDGYNYYANSVEEARQIGLQQNSYRYEYYNIPFTIDDVAVEELK